MRETQLPLQSDLVAPTDTGCGRGPLANSIEREDGRFLKRRREKCAGGMGLMMSGKDDPFPVLVLEVPANDAWHADFFLQPDRKSSAKGTETTRRYGEERFEQSLKGRQGLVVKADVIDLVMGESCLFKAIFDRPRGKGGIVFNPRKPFFLRCRDDTTVNNDRSGRIVIERRYSKNRCHGKRLFISTSLLNATFILTLTL